MNFFSLRNLFWRPQNFKNPIIIWCITKLTLTAVVIQIWHEIDLFEIVSVRTGNFTISCNMFIYKYKHIAQNILKGYGCEWVMNRRSSLRSESNLRLWRCAALSWLEILFFFLCVSLFDSFFIQNNWWIGFKTGYFSLNTFKKNFFLNKNIGIKTKFC